MRAEAGKGQAGFTLIELLIVVVLIAVVSLIAATGYRGFRERSILNRAARTVAADVALARSYAIRNRGNVSLVALEAPPRYELRDAAGNVLKARWFDGGSDLPLTSLDVQATGDSVTFNSRGMLISAPARIDVVRTSATRQVQVSALGRSRIVVQ